MKKPSAIIRLLTTKVTKKHKGRATLFSFVRRVLASLAGRALVFFVAFYNRIRRVGFDRDFHLGARFETYLDSIFIRERVLDSYLPIQMIGGLHDDLRFFRLTWQWRFDDLVDSSRKDGIWFFGHNSISVTGEAGPCNPSTRGASFHHKGREGRNGGNRYLVPGIRYLFWFFPLFLCALRVLCGEKLFLPAGV